MKKIIECVPNFSEGRDMEIIGQIRTALDSVDGAKVVDVDPGKATNRTVVTVVGEPEPLAEAVFRGIAKATELIDMRTHSGEHPRFGATDVCPFVPVSNASMEDCIELANKVGERVGRELGVPVYLYEYAASAPHRRNLASVRSGEYEGIAEKIGKPEWKPDFGPAVFNEKSGNIAISARDFLVAFNVNLNTTSVRRANSVAFDVREAGRIRREGNPVTGKIVTDENGESVRIPGACKGVKGIGWFIEEYGIAQISMNITNIRETPLHEAFQACVDSAHRRGLRVTGSELVGLLPLECMVDAGKYFLKKQQRSTGVGEAELVRIAAKTMGLDELGPFNPTDNIIEYKLREEGMYPLLGMKLDAFADETASESPAPGGGSISAYVGALGVSLGTMVANLSSHKRGWDKRWEEFSDWADKGQAIKESLLRMVDEDTNAFNAIMDAFRLPKGNEAEEQARHDAVQAATRNAIEVPFRVMKLSMESFELLRAMAEHGNPNSASDAGVGALCARTAVHGAFLNVRINSGELEDKAFVDKKLREGAALCDRADAAEREIVEIVNRSIGQDIPV